MDFTAHGIVVSPHGPKEQRVACPGCNRGSHDLALGVNIETGTFHCFRCNWKGRAGSVSDAPHLIVQFDDPAVAERKRERLRATWSETVALSHPKARAVRTYFLARALGEILKGPPAALRAHPLLEYWDGCTLIGRYPAMVALFRGASGDPVTLHCTYLRHDGCAKAGVPSPKKILGVPVKGATKGGAIHLFEPNRGVLGLCEGIESALSMHLIQRVPVWASFCADNLERIRLPTGLRELQIGIDIDESGKGEAVAKALAQRVMKWSPRTRVIYVKPELAGSGDLNDELRRRAQ